MCGVGESTRNGRPAVWLVCAAVTVHQTGRAFTAVADTDVDLHSLGLVHEHPSRSETWDTATNERGHRSDLLWGVLRYFLLGFLPKPRAGAVRVSNQMATKLVE